MQAERMQLWEEARHKGKPIVEVKEPEKEQEDICDVEFRQSTHDVWSEIDENPVYTIRC